MAALAPAMSREECSRRLLRDHWPALLDGRRVYGHQGTDEGIVCNLYVEPVSQTVFCVMTNGCKTTREDGIMRITRRLCTAAAEVFLPEAN